MSKMTFTYLEIKCQNGHFQKRQQQLTTVYGVFNLFLSSLIIILFTSLK